MKIKKAIIYTLIIILILAIQIVVGNMNEKNVKIPKVSGTFYPENQIVLENQIETMLGNVKMEYTGEKIKALIVPHAGYIYSGSTAAYAFKQLYLDLLLREEDSLKVIILAPNHTEYVEGLVISDYEYFQTPLGKVKVNSTNISAKINNAPFEKEHAIEVILPFLQKIFKDAKKKFTIVPVIVGDVTKEQTKEIAKDIVKEITENTIVIVSSDLSHFYAEEKANLIDNKTIENILTLENTNIDACGKNGITVLMEIIKLLKWNNPSLLDYTTSAKVTKDKREVVGYASFSIYENDKHLLIRLAKRSILNVIDMKGDNFKALEKEIPKEYLEKKGNFVTLTINKELRGCIGNITSYKSVFDGVIANSKFAAFQDPRFEELTEKEFYKIDIEISILSSPKECNYEEIERGDGVILRQGAASSVYLPQVWDQLVKKETFISSLCEKAGLSWNCYEENETKFQKFSVEIIE